MLPNQSLFGAFAAVLLSLAALAEPASGRTLRILSYNIHHAEGRDGVLDLARIADVIKAAQPDLVTLQEVDQGTSRSGHRNELNELAALTGMPGYFGKTINLSGGQYGNGVLVRRDLRVASVENHPLPNPAGGEARAVMELAISLDGDAAADFTLLATHFHHTSDETNRLAQAAFINDLAGELPGAAILAGDLNARPSSQTMATLRQSWTDATDAGNPGLNRTSQIDYVLYRLPAQWNISQRGRFIVNETTAVASDHYPILAALQFVAPSADFDGDGAVDGEDLLAWQRGVGRSATRASGDANYDGWADQRDLVVWQQQAGQPAQAAAVPEPAAAALALGLLLAQVQRARASKAAREEGCNDLKPSH